MQAKHYKITSPTSANLQENETQLKYNHRAEHVRFLALGIAASRMTTGAKSLKMKGIDSTWFGRWLCINGGEWIERNEEESRRKGLEILKD